MSCKRLCVQHHAKKNGYMSRYGSGQKRCQTCEIFIVWKGLFCPCCGYRLRTGPRKQEYKAKLRKLRSG